MPRDDGWVDPSIPNPLSHDNRLRHESQSCGRGLILTLGQESSSPMPGPEFKRGDRRHDALNAESICRLLDVVSTPGSRWREGSDRVFSVDVHRERRNKGQQESGIDMKRSSRQRPAGGRTMARMG